MEKLIVHKTCQLYKVKHTRRESKENIYLKSHKGKHEKKKEREKARNSHAVLIHSQDFFRLLGELK